jgi:hypothetical protein
MSTGKTEKRWVLEQLPGMFWNGQMMEVLMEGEPQIFPIFVMGKAQAQQFSDRKSAVFSQTMFGISFVEPRELEFTS